MFNKFNRSSTDDGNLASSRLYDQTDFYKRFIDDVSVARKLVIIESPFITDKRVAMMLPTLRKALGRGVKVVVNTKHLDELDQPFIDNAKAVIIKLQELGVTILFTGGHHRKLAIIDDRILYEGSLNILSQNDSCELMRRINSEQLVAQMLRFIKLEEFIN
jgi:phosphatidylserine/phosphatidylglycerophosphate/cardiolipin synthase-like enzyme